MSLGPREEILPIVNHYFQHANAVTPLFHKPSFMRMLDAWYLSSTTKSRAEWAAIQVVVALGLRTPKPEAGQVTIESIQRANKGLNNAQSVLSELVTHDKDLLGIQALLGIVMLLHNSSDLKPCSVIIASAIRLAHRLCLHSSQNAEHLSAEEALQNSRVFWIAYALDKVCLPFFWGV